MLMLILRLLGLGGTVRMLDHFEKQLPPRKPRGMKQLIDKHFANNSAPEANGLKPNNPNKR